MLRVKAGLGLVVSLGLLASAGVVGCSADGLGEEYIPELAVEPGTTEPTPALGGNHNDPVPLPVVDSGKRPIASDAGRADASRPPRADASTRDATPDVIEAGPSTPTPGTTCVAAGDVKERACGFCGQQETVCDDDGAGGFAWSEYGPCGGEVQDEGDRCLPGTVQDNECGLCGKSGDVCQRDCHWGRGTCREPAGACTPDTVRYITAGCGMSVEKVRKQTCSESCVYGAASPLPCGDRDSFVNITRTKGFYVSVDGTMNGEINKLNGGSGTAACAPATLVSDAAAPTNVMPYTYLEIRNPHDKEAKVEVEFRPDLPPSTWMYTFAAVYNGALPNDIAARTACVKSNSYCSTGGGSWSCFKGTDAFTIPANGRVFVYVQPTSRPSATIPLPIKYTATVTTVGFL